MARGKRLKLGDIYEIPLPDGKKAYARLFEEFTLAIYEGRYDSVDELPDDAPYFRFIGVYKPMLGDGEWPIVAHRGFEHADDAWPPPKCIVDAITLKGSLYHKGKIIPCSFEECKGLEVVAGWRRDHVVDMLMGETKWDDSIRKPTH